MRRTTVGSLVCLFFGLFLFACNSEPPSSRPTGDAGADATGGTVCETDDDCSDSSAGSICNTTTGSCVECAEDGDCGDGQICLSDSNTCAACESGDDCAAGQLCRDNSCVKGCETDGDCPDDQICDPEGDACIGCANDTHCSDDQRCDTDQNRCVGCLNDSDCPRGNVCRKNSCTEGCSADNPCPEGKTCKTSQGACVGCLDDTDCSDDAKPRCDTPRNTCVECLPGSDNCEPGTYCDGASKTCKDGCKNDAGCKVGNPSPASQGKPRCLTVDNECVACLEDADCAQGEICGADNTCTKGCKRDEQCGEGQICCGGQCQKLGTDVNCASCGDTCGSGKSCCDGQCKSLTTLQNCGDCGNSCQMDNSAPTCSSGTCQISSCKTGFRDCDDNAANGCEIDIKTDTRHCGACGNTCDIANATETCQNGVCQIASCDGTFGNCDSDRSNGCETDLAASADHCGQCGNDCSFANGSGTCNGGSCEVDSCDAEYADCDGLGDNGCEIHTATDTQHCGSCGNVCTVGNGSPACKGGSCEVAACNSGFADCNDSVSDGCEADLNNSEQHCGACGNACAAGAVCRSGRCFNKFTSTGSDGKFNPQKDTTLKGGIHNFTTITIPKGVTVHIDPKFNNGELDLRATGEIVVNGTIDLSGGNGGDQPAEDVSWVGAGGGDTAYPPGEGNTTQNPNGNDDCNAIPKYNIEGGKGGAGFAGEDGERNNCGPVDGGQNGGGMGGTGGGGGGGGWAGGAGGAVGFGAAGGDGGGPFGGKAGDGSQPLGGRGGDGGGAPYDGGKGDDHTRSNRGGAGGGGSIGKDAANDLAMTNTFRPGSAGGGGGYDEGSGGGGGGGAIRLASPSKIVIRGKVLADGGEGGGTQPQLVSRGGAPCCGGGAGGGGSGGAIFISAPTVTTTNSAEISAVGGDGGVQLSTRDSTAKNGGDGGLGRIRFSLTPGQSTLNGTFEPGLQNGKQPASSKGAAYIAKWPK